jgi:HPt (histidine-containing phosphotransfer) domain-containing protein
MKPNRILRFEMPDSPVSGGPRNCGCRAYECECTVVDSLVLFKQALTLKPYDAIFCIKGMALLHALEAMEAAHAVRPEVTFLYLTSQAADAWGGPAGKEVSALSRSLDLRILDRLRIFSKGDEAGLFHDLVCSFLAQSKEKLGGLRKSAGLRDFPSLAKAAHGLKGLSLNFGALAMTRKCDALQSAAEAGEWPAVVEALAELSDALTDTRIAFSTLPGLDGREMGSMTSAVAPPIAPGTA